MKRGSLFGTGIWPFLLVPSLLWIPTTFHHWHAVEKTVAENTRQALGEEHSWATVETFNRGRNVLLIGTASNQSTLDSAIQLAQQAEGVRTVEFVGELDNTAPPQPASLTIARTEKGILLQGEVDSESTISSLLEQTAQHYPDQAALNKLEVGDNTTALPAGLIKLSAELPENINVTVLGDSITLEGTVASQDQARDIERQVATNFAGAVQNSMNVEIVENDQCEELLSELLTTAKINFETGQAAIKQSSDQLIDNIADIAKRCPDATFEVAGHTDSIGDLAMNMQLSQARAQAVVDSLVTRGLSQQRFSVQGYGPKQPIADNNTAAGKAANRRIEFKLKQ